jgi:hypothetical protein
MTDPRIPAGLGWARRSILEVALAELDKGVRETRANDGPEIRKYRPTWAAPGPWCAWFAGWVARQATGDYLPGGRLGKCDRLMSAAKLVGLWVPKDDGALPVPGDAFVMDTDGAAGTNGHIGFVLRVSVDGRTINTVEGNTGNRVRLGVRSLADVRILGWICTVPAEPSLGVERGTIRGEDVAKDGTR